MLSNEDIYELLKKKTILPLCLCKLISEFHFNKINTKKIEFHFSDMYNFQEKNYNFPLLIRNNINYYKKCNDNKLKRELFFIDYEIEKLNEYIQNIPKENLIYKKKLISIFKLLKCNYKYLNKLNNENNKKIRDLDYLVQISNECFHIEKILNEEIVSNFSKDTKLQYIYLFAIENTKRKTMEYIIDIYSFRNIIIFNDNNNIYENRKNYQKKIIIDYALKNNENIYLYDENKYYK